MCLLYVEGGIAPCNSVMVCVKGNSLLFVCIIVNRCLVPSFDLLLKVVDAVEKFADLGSVAGLYVIVFAIEFGSCFCLKWENLVFIY